jgi:hypothetical protein
VRKDTTFWIKGMMWEGKTCSCTKPHGQTIERNTDKIFRNSLPAALCLELLTLAMATQSQTFERPWVLSLYEGVGSMSAATVQMPGVWNVRLANGIPTSVDRHCRLVSINMDLSHATRMCDIFKTVWHVAGLLPSELVAITSSPPCTTTCAFDAMPNNWHRDHSKPCHPALSDLAMLHDLMYQHWFHVLFTMPLSCWVTK